MNEPPQIPPPFRLEDHPPFRNWAAFVKARKDASELSDRRALETQKIAADFGKLIITNLHLINAGGLFAAPTLFNAISGSAPISRAERLLFLILPMGLLAAGLILASTTAFFVYRNFDAVAEQWSADKLMIDADLEITNPTLNVAVAQKSSSMRRLLMQWLMRRSNPTFNGLSVQAGLPRPVSFWPAGAWQ